MAKNLVICCDGTNNSVERTLTNVGRVSRIAESRPGVQHVYYDVGVGVEAAPGLMTRVGATFSRWAGSAFGAGLVRNVREAYLEIVDHYEPGDRLFVFGFSRGAYTARVLAGLLRHYGLLKKEHRSMAEEVVKKFQGLFPREGSKDDKDPIKKKAYLEKTFGEARQIKASNSISCPVHFMGIWDTVSSLGWAYDPKTFPNTKEMPEVQTIRHAMAIDERRAKFRPNRVHHLPAVQQDIQEVWFAGVHCDVGGGYAPEESGLALGCLRWMLREAEKAGMLIDANRFEALAPKANLTNDELGLQHESLDSFWWGLEYMRLPHRREEGTEWINEMVRYQGKGWRSFRPGDSVSRSVQRRMAAHPIKNANWSQAQSTVVWVD